jgi:hypothetical protein
MVDSNGVSSEDPQLSTDQWWLHRCLLIHVCCVTVMKDGRNLWTPSLWTELNFPERHVVPNKVRRTRGLRRKSYEKLTINVVQCYKTFNIRNLLMFIIC